MQQCAAERIGKRSRLSGRSCRQYTAMRSLFWCRMRFKTFTSRRARHSRNKRQQLNVSIKTLFQWLDSATSAVPSASVECVMFFHRQKPPIGLFPFPFIRASHATTLDARFFILFCVLSHSLSLEKWLEASKGSNYFLVFYFALFVYLTSNWRFYIIHIKNFKIVTAVTAYNFLYYFLTASTIQL